MTRSDGVTQGYLVCHTHALLQNEWKKHLNLPFFLFFCYRYFLKLLTSRKSCFQTLLPHVRKMENTSREPMLIPISVYQFINPLNYFRIIIISMCLSASYMDGSLLSLAFHLTASWGCISCARSIFLYCLGFSPLKQTAWNFNHPVSVQKFFHIVFNFNQSKRASLS